MERDETYLNYLEISSSALYNNAKTIKAHIDVPIIGMVKCDGYGVSIEEAARAWQKAGVTMFGVSLPQEASALRRAGFQEDILLLSPVSDAATLQAMLEQEVILTITGLRMAKFIGRLGVKDAPVRVHVAVDSGMGRFGVKWTDTEQLKAIYRLQGFSFAGIFSHFACSFEKRYYKTKIQLQRFLKVTEELRNAGYELGIRHIANSCAALRFPQTHLDAVRIGSALIGKLPAQVPVTLQQVGVFKAQVVDYKIFFPGDTTGYASVCRIKHLTRAVVVAIGRENGFGYMKKPDNLCFRNFISWLYHMMQGYLQKPYVMYDHQRLKLVGRIGTQYTLFDAAELDIYPGDYVTAGVDMLFPHGRRRVI